MTTHQSASVTLSGVTKAFGGKTVLHDVDLAVGDGELLALLGPSGCGKTTALRIIAGFEHPDAGAVVIGDRDVTRVRARRRGIGIVFQAYSLFPHMTAVENVAYGLKVRRMAAAARLRRATELLDLVGLAEHAEKFPQQLSGGQQQRVALARAFAIEPKVLLLDEPLSALDAKVRVQLREEIRRIQRELGMTTVLVTHDQEEALTMADRVAVMRDGRIEQVGAPDDVYRRPASAYVSEFVGVTNRIRGAVAADGMIDVLGDRVEVPTGGRALGADVDLLVRPEDLEIGPAEHGAGRVDSIVLRGATSSVQIEHPALPGLLRVDLPSGKARRYQVGDRVEVTIDSPWATVDDPADPADLPGGEAAA